MFEQIKRDQLAARKTKAPEAALLTTLIGEIAIIGKNDGNRDVTPSEVTGVLQKFLKNIRVITDLGVDKVGEKAFEQALFEMNVIKRYLPQELSEERITEEINKVIATGVDLKKLKPTVMQYFKANFDGQYDAKVVMSIIGKLS